MITRTFASKRNPGTTYTTEFEPDTGKTRCTCNGFIYSRKDPRECTHIRQTVQEAAGTAETSGEVQDGPAPVLASAAGAARPAPMLASAMPNGRNLAWYVGREDWFLEEKWDGHRIVVRKNSAATVRVEAWGRPSSSRKGDGKKDLPAFLIDAFLQMPDGVYDGELVVPGGTSSDVGRLDCRNKLRIVLFDVLEIMDSDVTELTYHERRQILALSVSHHEVQANLRPVVTCAPLQPVTEAAVSKIWERGGEGAILKRGTSCYRPGARSADWVKVKREGTITLTVAGFKAGSFGPYSVIKLNDGNGREVTTVKTKNTEIRDAIAANPAAFIGRPLVVWFVERTPDGNLRHPMFDHFADAGDRPTTARAKKPANDLVTPRTRQITLPADE